ncbi:MAG: RNA polymerase sigma factor RpoH [Alphaproteobacteria bacterium]|nr:RNA polymerase sigma factor RpoH [Alphaproteobacteria bacterium]
MAANSQLPVLSGESGLARYLQEIRKFPVLEADEEYMLAKRWQEHADVNAAQRLVTSHLRLVAKVASGYRGYGLPLSELISEGNIGMMQAVKKFEPDRGFRLATYAIWWIRASIQEYILHSWSLVKIGTTAAQKKLFFNLRKIKNKLQLMEEGDLPQEKVKEIAQQLQVSDREVVEMNRRLSQGDFSLNTTIREDGDGEWQDWLVEASANQEIVLGEEQENNQRRQMVSTAFRILKPRERDILIDRRLKDNPATLDELSKKHGISRERVRQIEARAFEKLQQAIKKQIDNPPILAALPRPSSDL